MSAQRASAPVRLARFAAAVLMIALAAVIVVRLAGRRGGGPAETPAAPPPEGQVVDLKERVHQQEFQDGKPVVDIRGESFSRGADGRNRLTGSIEILNLDPAGETRSRLTADEVAYDPGSLLFTVGGRVKVEAAGMVLEGDSFSYDKGQGLFATTSGGRFVSKTVSGRAPEISFRENADEVRLGGGFRLEIAARDGKDRATAVSGGALVLDRGARRGLVTGKALIEGADFRGSSESASFVVSADESSLESIVLEGAPKIVLAGIAPSGEGSGEVGADRIAVTFSREPSGMAAQTSGSSSLTFRPRPDKTVTVLSPELLLNVFRADRSATWTASGGIKAGIAEAGSVSRTLEGEEATFDGAKILHVTGGTDRPAVADSAEARIEAPEILLASQSGDVLASGGVSCVLRQGEGRRTVGFFSPLEDVLVSSDRLEVRAEPAMSFFSGHVQFRQGVDSLRAGKVQIADQAGLMTGGQGIEATLTEASAAGKPGRKVELSGREMAYSTIDGTLTLSTKASVHLSDTALEAGTVSVVISRGGRAVESLSASTDVTVTHGPYVAHSKAATYEAATGRLTLTGNPVLTDDKGGSARGAKLTFDLADDKISIENEGSGRATTVIRS